MAVVEQGIDMLMGGLAIRRNLEVQPKSLDELAEFAYLLWVGIVVYPIDEWSWLFFLFWIPELGVGSWEWCFLFPNLCGYDTVGEEHKLFDEMVGIERLVEEDASRLVVVIE